MAIARRFAVLGSPVSHSKSPDIHRAAYELLELPWSYERFELEADDLADFLTARAIENISTRDGEINTDGQGGRFAVREGLWGGFSLTMPLKERAAQLAASLDADAALTGAVNTLTFADGLWHGANTDVSGIRHALAGVPATTIGMLGTGSTARSALVALRGLYPDAKVHLWGRNPEKSEALRSFAEPLFGDIQVLANPHELLGSQLVVSTLPQSAADELVGSNLELRHALDALTANQCLFDVSYHPWPSALASRYLAAGASVISGIEMLIWQAIGQIELFTRASGQSIELDKVALYMVMKRTAASQEA